MTTKSTSGREPSSIEVGLRGRQRRLFLEAYARSGVVADGLRASGLSRSTYYRWRQEDADFDEACEDALEDAVDAAEAELRRRAVEGEEEVVLIRGEPVFKRDPDEEDGFARDELGDRIPLTVNRKSDRLLEVYMRAHRRNYRDRTDVNVNAGGGGPGGIHAQVNVNLISPDAPRPRVIEHDPDGDAAQDA